MRGVFGRGGLEGAGAGAARCRGRRGRHRGVPPGLRWARRSNNAAHGPADRLALMRAAQGLARKPDTALRAGKRQTISNFGVFGFALITSPTFADAFAFGRQHLNLAGSLVRITFEKKGKVGILRSHNPRALGAALPFAAEFWRSSMSTLMGHVLQAPFPSLAMYFPYPAPKHADAYRRTFNCAVHFNSDVMEWHFDTRVLGADCPNADALTASVCQDFCERVVSGGRGQTELQREVRRMCLTRPVAAATAGFVAAEMGWSLRTFHRRLESEGATFQALLDETWESIATEYLVNTTLSVQEIAHRCGYSDASNFRKAFLRWTGKTPAAFRSSNRRP